MNGRVSPVLADTDNGTYFSPIPEGVNELINWLTFPEGDCSFPSLHYSDLRAQTIDSHRRWILRRTPVLRKLFFLLIEVSVTGFRPEV